MYKNLSLIYKELEVPKEQVAFYNSKIQSARRWGRITTQKQNGIGREINLYLKEEVEEIVKAVPFGTFLKRGAKLKPKAYKEPKEPKVKKEKVPKIWYVKVKIKVPLRVLAKIEDVERLENVLNKLIPLRLSKIDFKDTDKSLPSRVEILKISKANYEKLREVCQYDKQIKNLLRNILINYANRN
jgi:hypothetical protein